MNADGDPKTRIVPNPAGFILAEPTHIFVGVPVPGQSTTPFARWEQYHDQHRAALVALMADLHWSMDPGLSRQASGNGRGAVYAFKTWDPRHRPGRFPEPLKAYLRANFVDVWNALEEAIKAALKFLPETDEPAMVAVRALLDLAGKGAKAADEVVYMPGEEFWRAGDAA